MQGPASELCDVVFFPISDASGLRLVHHTWAGTFVLAALCLVFPGLNIVLLDSDCVPVTLFEVADLWQEALLRGFNHAPPLLEEDWQSIPLGSSESQDLAIRKYKQKVVTECWKVVAAMVSHGRDDRDMTQSECQAWIGMGCGLVIGR